MAALCSGMNEMEAARFNVYWYLSLVVPAIIMLGVSCWRRKPILWLGIVVSLVATYLLCNAAIQTKWRIRNEIARTDEEREYATTDGANLVFTALFIGPFEAILYTSIWGVVGWKILPRKRKRDEVRT